MPVLEHEVRAISGVGLGGLRRCLFTRDDYHAMANAGVFRDKAVELIEGEIIEMAPIGDGHAALNDPLADELREIFGAGYCVRTQCPIALGTDARPSNPQPDITVAIGPWRRYFTRKPGPADIVLIVEIAESTLPFDRAVKAALYASAGIPEYWIINLIDQQVDVHRTPSEAGYGEVTVYRAGERVSPLAGASGKALDLGEFVGGVSVS